MNKIFYKKKRKKIIEKMRLVKGDIVDVVGYDRYIQIIYFKPNALVLYLCE